MPPSTAGAEAGVFASKPATMETAGLDDQQVESREVRGASHARIFLRDSATERRETAVLEVLSPRIFGTSPTRIHKSLRVTLAMAAGITDQLWKMMDIVTLINANEPASKKRGSNKKRIPN